MSTAHDGKTSNGPIGRKSLKSIKKRKRTMVNCQDCGDNFEGHAALKLHTSVVHEGKNPNECPNCGKMFSTSCSEARIVKANVIRHLNSCGSYGESGYGILRLITQN